jgi:hypothetical protein
VTQRTRAAHLFGASRWSVLWMRSDTNSIGRRIRASTSRSTGPVHKWLRRLPCISDAAITRDRARLPVNGSCSGFAIETKIGFRPTVERCTNFPSVAHSRATGPALASRRERWQNRFNGTFPVTISRTAIAASYVHASCRRPLCGGTAVQRPTECQVFART